MIKGERGRGLEERALVPDGVGDEYKVSAINDLGFLSYLADYRRTQDKVNTKSDSDRSIPALHDDYTTALWRFAEKVYGKVKYRVAPIEESELDRLTDPEEDSWLEKWFGKIGVEKEETQIKFYRSLFKDQILAAKYILTERGYDVISRAEHQETVKTGQRNLRWWVVGAAAGILLITAAAVVGTGSYVYAEYVKPFNQLRKDVESGDIFYRFSRIGITESDIEKIKNGFKKMTPEERRELFFGIPPAKKKEQEKEEQQDKKEEESKGSPKEESY